MNSKVFPWRSRCITLLVMLSVSVAALAESRQKSLSGVINGYTPQTTTGPYEVRGPWSLKWDCDSGKADFFAALNMEFSDGWVITKNGANFDPNARSAHTHHITVLGGEVTRVANGFRVDGKATFTLNGGAAPTTIEPSAVVIEVTGGNDVEFSNITVTFLAPGSMHFGGEPLPGVVQRVE
jgi:hypothetical protein